MLQQHAFFLPQMIYLNHSSGHNYTPDQLKMLQNSYNQNRWTAVKKEIWSHMQRHKLTQTEFTSPSV